MEETQTISAIKKMVIGSIIAEYGALQLLDASKEELKNRVKNVISSVKSVENWFLHNPNVSETVREQFKNQFNSEEITLLAELFDTVYGINADSIEHIIEQINKNLDNQ